jgi:hypothetical protein
VSLEEDSDFEVFFVRRNSDDKLRIVLKREAFVKEFVFLESLRVVSPLSLNPFLERIDIGVPAKINMVEFDKNTVPVDPEYAFLFVRSLFNWQNHWLAQFSCETVLLIRNVCSQVGVSSTGILALKESRRFEFSDI